MLEESRAVILSYDYLIYLFPFARLAAVVTINTDAIINQSHSSFRLALDGRAAHPRK